MRLNGGTNQLAISLVCWLSISFSPSYAKNVAIIGGGVSGTFVAKYLADYDTNCTVESVTIFDPLPIGEATLWNQEQDDDWQGSRVSSLERKDGTIVELGASVFISDFRLVSKMIADDPTLEIGPAHNMGPKAGNDEQTPSSIGIYHGDGIWALLTTNTPSIWVKIKLLYRYNVDFWKISRAATKAQQSLHLIHQWLDMEHSNTFFESPEEMWRASGLIKPAHMSFDDFLDAIGLDDKLAWWRTFLPFQGSLRAELLTAINLCNYNQANSQLNGLVGVGSFISTKMELYSLNGGNRKILQSAWKQAQTNHNGRCQKPILRHIAEKVTAVVGSSNLENGTMELFAGEGRSLGHYDVVILAAPLQQCRISFMIQSDKDSSVLHDMPLGERIDPDHPDHSNEEGQTILVAPKPLPPSATRPYMQVITTVVRNATLRPEHFYLTPTEMPRAIYMTEQGKAKEYNITAVTKIRASDGLYKIFSSEQLDAGVLQELFGPDHQVEFVKQWGGPHGGATPDYQGEGKTMQYLLYDSASGLDGHSSGAALYYPNAIEASFACMELSAIGAKSVARLVAKRLGLLTPLIPSDAASAEEL